MTSSKFNTDTDRWGELSRSNDKPSWNARNDVIGKFVPENASVLDIGSGNQSVRQCIPDSCSYQPVDCVDGNNVIIIDFNKENVADRLLEEYHDIAICSGVLEYITDTESFFKFVTNNASSAIFTYVFEDNRVANDSKLNGWCAGVRKADMYQLFSHLGISVVHTTNYKRHSIMLLTFNKSKEHNFNI